MKPPRVIDCPGCHKCVTLLPSDNQTYEQAYREAAIAHERRGCRHAGYAMWGYDPEWDSPQTRPTIRSGGKIKLVQHPDGYMFSVPAEWSKDVVDLYIAKTRKRRSA